MERKAQPKQPKQAKASQSKPKQAKESKSKQQSQQEFKFKMSSVLRDANICPGKQQQAKARTDFELNLQLRSSQQQGALAKILRNAPKIVHERPKNPEKPRVAQNQPESSKIPPKTHPKPSPNPLKIAISCNFNLEALFSQSLTPQGLPNPPPRPSKIEATYLKNRCGKQHTFSKQFSIFFSILTSKSMLFWMHFECIFETRAKSA